MQPKIIHVLLLGAGLLVAGYVDKFEELWVEKLDLPPFWKRRKHDHK